MGGTSRTAGTPWEGPVYAPSNLSNERFYSIGALSANGLDCRFYKKAKYTLIKFLKVLRRKYGKVLLFVDNASYHRAGLVREQLTEWNGDVVLRFLPPYTPELDPVEIQWRAIKRRLPAKVFETLDDMERPVQRLPAKREVLPVKLFKYLTGWLQKNRAIHMIFNHVSPLWT